MPTRKKKAAKGRTLDMRAVARHIGFKEGHIGVSCLVSCKDAKGKEHVGLLTYSPRPFSEYKYSPPKLSYPHTPREKERHEELLAEGVRFISDYDHPEYSENRNEPRYYKLSLVPVDKIKAPATYQMASVSRDKDKPILTMAEGEKFSLMKAPTGLEEVWKISVKDYESFKKLPRSRRPYLDDPGDLLSTHMSNLPPNLHGTFVKPSWVNFDHEKPRLLSALKTIHTTPKQLSTFLLTKHPEDIMDERNTTVLGLLPLYLQLRASGLTHKEIRA